MTPQQQYNKANEKDDQNPLPNGVFTLMADCYSPTCSRSKPCYSVICPRRFDEKTLISASPQSSLTSRPTEKKVQTFR
jgi:RHO1 GDP-GTP exchange protein 1/2